MKNIDEDLLNEILPNCIINADAYNIRKNGIGIERKTSEFISIESKKDNKGIDIYIKEDSETGVCDIPVILTESGLTDKVYNDFHIGKNSNSVIIAGCGINNPSHNSTRHDGIHRFYVSENAKVKYIEKHYAEGSKDGKNILNPVTEIYLDKNSYMIMETSQIKGVDDTIRTTKAILEENSTLIINEKIYTNNKNNAKTVFDVKLNGKNSSVHVTSRSVAEDNSYQEFNSKVVGNTSCYGHVECDAILKDNGKVKAIPQIYAKNVDARLIHEASIGKIAGEQLIKLMSLGINEKDAEEIIIKGFLK